MASSSSTGNATEHALDAVARDRADQSQTNLVCTLFMFLTYILQDPFSTPGFIHATEQDNSGTEIVDEGVCIDIVEATLAKEELAYNTPQLVEHKRLWDIVTRDKEGNDKEHWFCDWCRRVASHSKKFSTATEHAAAEAEETQKSACYRSLVEDMFAKDLTTKQKREHKYKLQKDKAITSQQRSWVTHMLRKNLGDAKVAYYILNYGVPEVLNVPVRFKKVINKALLQNMLDEFMIWHCALLQYIVQYKADPHMAIALRLSDLNEGEWRETRQRLKNEARLRLKDGARLSKQKDTGKRMWGEMSSTEKQLIEDYETNKSKREYDMHVVKKPRTNRGS